MATYGFETTGDTIVSDFSDQVKGKIFLITGPSEGGIGAETVISLARATPSTILLLGRSISKIQPIISQITTISPSTTTKFISIDLSSLSSVRTAAEKILADTNIPHIDVIINNAAIMACPYSLTEDGFETQFATNHLSHFLLTNLLQPKILRAKSPRIVNVSSMGHLKAGVLFDDLDFSQGTKYDLWDAYAQGKTANILFSVSLNSRLKGAGKGSAWALHPGSIATGLQKHITEELRQKVLAEWKAVGHEVPKRKTLQQGCATQLRAALDPGLEIGGMVVDEEGRGGESCYLSDCVVVESETGANGAAVKGYALDAGFAEKLWKISEEMVGEKFAW